MNETATNQTLPARPERWLLDPIEDAVAAIARGLPVGVLDDRHRKNEAALVLAAQRATPESLGFLIRYTGGVVCAPMAAARTCRLNLPPMTGSDDGIHRAAFTVSVDAGAGVSTGISAADRATTLRMLADPGTGPHDLQRPGHVFPVQECDGGLGVRPGHTEASVELMRLAGLAPVAATSELCHDNGTMMRLDAVRAFCDQHRLKLIAIDQVRSYGAAFTPRAGAAK